MSHPKILIRALPNVEFVHGFPGIPAGPDRPQATIRGTVEIRLGQQPVKAKYVKVELRKTETIPYGNRSEAFVDLVGQSPITLWEARDDHDTLSNDDFPFNIRVPETTPPSIALEKGAGIKYEVVVTLSAKGKKGLLRREASTPIFYSVPIVIDKHELHSTWPVYAQPESRQVVSNGLILAVDRSNTCFAPGDRLVFIATLKSESLSPVVLRGFEFSLRQTIIYRGGPQSLSKKHAPLVQTSVIGEQKLPVSITLYGGTQQRAELGCMIPGSQTTSSVNAGRHIDIGYSLNIKAIVDMANPVVMDLPVTITNWPRHVSAEIMRRIGTAPNLSPTSQKPFTTPVLQSLRASGPLHPPPSCGLPSLPSGNGLSHSAPAGSLPSGPHASPNLGHYSVSMNPYSFQQNSNSTVAHQSSPQLRAAPEVTNSDTITANNPSNPDELRYTRQPIDVTATAPSHQGDKPDFGLTGPDRRPSITTGRSTINQPTSDVEAIGSNNVSQYSRDSDVRGNQVTNPSLTTGRRPRAMSRTLKIVNVNDDILEEASPVKKKSLSSSFDVTATASPRTTPRPASPPEPSSTSPWPTAGEEKQRLYETAKVKAQKVQAQAIAKAAGEDSSQQNQSPRPSNGQVSPPRQASPASINQSGSERPRTTSPSLSRTPWPTAEEEKLRLFERAQAKVRQTQQRLVNTPPSSGSTPSSTPSAATGSAARPSHQRTTSSNSSQEFRIDRGLVTYTSTSAPTMSPGAVLYSHAMASINRSASASPYTPSVNTPSVNTSPPRRNASHTGSSTAASGNGINPSTRQIVSAVGDKSALRYQVARDKVQRQQLAGGSIPEAPPQEGPIPYEELFGSRSDASPPSGPAANGTSPPLSEKEIIHRAFEARESAAAAVATAAAPIALVAAVTRTPSVRTITPTPPAGPAAGLSEKEVLRRAFEARDAAMIRSGQTPPTSTVPLQPTPPPVQYSPPVAVTSVRIPSTMPLMHHPSSRSSSVSGIPSSSNGQPAARPPLSEKEQMRLAFETRDRAIVAQQAPPPPDYEMQSSLPASGPPAAGPSPPAQVWNGRYDSHLSAEEEKVQLRARYATTDTGGETHTSFPGEELRNFPQSEGPDPPSSPVRAPSHKSHKSDTSETFLRRDPSISAGKKRASQILPMSPPPPPLPPRPPAEYIEETKLEDRRNTLIASVTIPPSDFSSSFDLGFASFSAEPTSSEHLSG